jgi:hypothetical protein
MEVQATHINTWDQPSQLSFDCPSCNSHFSWSTALPAPKQEMFSVLCDCGVTFAVRNPLKFASRVAPSRGQHGASRRVLVWSGGILISFFLPWFQILGHGVSGYDIGQLGSYGNYAWSIPVLAVGTILATFAGQDNRLFGALTGLVPLGAIGYALLKIGAESGPDAAGQVLQVAQQVFSIGAYLTLLCSIALLVSAAQPLQSSKSR